jgi:hypothetical protein
MKVTLTAATLLASVAASSQQEVSKAASLSAMKAKTQLKAIQTAQHAKTLSAVKDFKLANKGVSLSARSVFNKRGMVGAAPIRTLRGKGGKGKGKGKDEEVEGSDSTAATKYLQMSYAWCAGTDMGLGPISEDLYFLHAQFKSGTCFNAIDVDGVGFSYVIAGAAEPFAISETTYSDHDCMEENFIDEIDLTDEFTMGGELTPSDSCTDTGFGYGMRFGIFETAIVAPSHAVATGESASLAGCRSGTAAGNLAMYDYVTIDVTEVNFYGSFTSVFCNSDDDVTSYQYDVSNCGAETPTITINEFSDTSCSVPSGSEVNEPDSCFFDYDYFVEEIGFEGGAAFFYEFNTCYA